MRKAALFLLLAASGVGAEELPLYVGSRAADQQGIQAAKLDSETGRLTGLGFAAPMSRPLWLEKGSVPKILYSVNDDGSVVTLTQEGNGHLREIGRVSSGGGGPTHLSLDPASFTLFAANYGTGQVAALPVKSDGTLAAPVSVQTDQGSGPTQRQKGPHAHEAVLDPSRHFLLVPDLGADKIFIYRFEAATRQLQAAGSEPLPPGSGPRHMVFHPNGKWAFLITELSAEVKAYRWDAKRGELTLIETKSTLASDFQGKKSGAEIALSPDGRFLYLSNRGEDTIVAFSIDAKSGALSELQRIASQGRDPWAFGFARGGRWMLVANEASGDVSVLERDGKSGKLRPTGEKLTILNPISLLIP